MKAVLPPRKYEIWKSLKAKEEELFDKAYDINNLEKMLKFQNPDGSFSKYPVI